MSRPWDVLVVDDEAVVRGGVKLVLEPEGLTVAQAATVAEALASEALNECRLLLCDLMLQGESGLEVVSEARRRRPALPIVLMTGYATDDNAALGARCGATDFLAKPFDDVELLDQVRRVLVGARTDEKEGSS
ncbi:MAG: response regulator [Candidatus Eisenbacteria bacterium]|uniref:Response regulator n=1 Tax=Eiseniibacteriota bacterium TaxID=2212470 RepID=A0A933W781_UNCEI|nr:response regulator [Candidatus Eisenbacteria bacterium]